jgi:L-asparagine transporter-like permease
MSGIRGRTFLLLVLIGIVVFSVRGGGSEAERWRAALLMVGIVALLVVGQLVVAWVRKRRGEEAPQDDDN